MKKTLLTATILLSLSSMALDCKGEAPYDELIKKSDFIYKGTLKDRTLFNDDGYEIVKNTMTVLKVYKGNPDTNEVMTHKPLDIEEGVFDGFDYDYAASKQVKKDVEYFVVGNYNEEVFHGLCGGGIYKTTSPLKDYIIQ